mgnify:CR=1 FL=1
MIDVSMRTETFTLNASSEVLVQRPWSTESNSVVLCLPGDSPSGWSSKTWVSLGERFLSAGIAVASLKYPRLTVEGVDLCPLNQSADAWENLWRLLNELGFSSKRFVVASSFGAAVLLERPEFFEKIETVCLKSPAVDLLPAYLGDFRYEEMRRWAQSGDKSPAGEAFTALLKAKGYESAVSLDAPTFVLHGTSDEIVPFSQAELFCAIAPNSQLIPIHDADHRLSAEADWEMVVSEITRLILKSENKSPSTYKE